MTHENLQLALKDSRAPPLYTSYDSPGDAMVVLLGPTRVGGIGASACLRLSPQVVSPITSTCGILGLGSNLPLSGLKTARFPTNRQPVRRHGVTLPRVATVSRPSPDVDYEPQEQPDKQVEQFQWTRQWYPIVPVDFLDASRPHAHTLMGKDLVLWRDGNGNWSCFDDACPHRLAPLSEGRIEADGQLLCAYHEWRFNGSGACTTIPTAKDAATEARICSQPKSCAVRYPVQVAQGLLWVWPEAGADAVLESFSRSPRLFPEADDTSGRVKCLPYYFRDLPYGHDFFFENLVDPAHVPVTHHNVAGNRYTDPDYMAVEEVRPVSAQEGFKYAVNNGKQQADAEIAASTTDFQPPCLVRIDSSYKDGSKMLLCLYSSPIRPGWTRHIGRQILIKSSPEAKLPKGLAFFAQPMPVWVSHILASLFLHQDHIFLHHQEKIATLLRPQTGKAIDKYFMPTSADRMVIVLRTWFEKLAGGGVHYFRDTPMPEIERVQRAVYDVYHTHTEKCAVCCGALQGVKKAQIAAIVVALVASVQSILVAAAAASAQVTFSIMSGALPAVATQHAVHQLPPFAAIAWAVVALLGVGMAVVLEKVKKMFYVYEFSHAANN